MAESSRELDGIRIVQYVDDAPEVRTEKDAIALITAAWANHAKVVVLPAERLHPDFFRLSTGVAGDIIQKFVNYGVALAILGDIDVHLAESSALRDFVYECNQGPRVWFVRDEEELRRQLQRHPQSK